MTALLLISVSYFPKASPYILELASTTAFINAIGIYISHLDASVRRCGMLAAEVVAHLCDKKLDFGEWEGDDYGKAWCRTLRTLLKARDVDVPLEMEDTEEEGRQEPVEESVIGEITSLGAQHSLTEPSKSKIVYKTSSGYDSDDSMTGYASPPSSRSASLSPSELADIEKDPSLNVGVKKVPRPVYLAQLGDLFRGGSSKTGPDDPHEADRIEMALNTAEELIRKKKGFGTELGTFLIFFSSLPFSSSFHFDFISNLALNHPDENAVNLVFALLSLQDNFDLEDFSEKRQGALNALVAGSPRKATPYVADTLDFCLVNSDTDRLHFTITIVPSYKSFSRTNTLLISASLPSMQLRLVLENWLLCPFQNLGCQLNVPRFQAGDYLRLCITSISLPIQIPSPRWLTT